MTLDTYEGQIQRAHELFNSVVAERDAALAKVAELKQVLAGATVCLNGRPCGCEGDKPCANCATVRMWGAENERLQFELAEANENAIDRLIQVRTQAVTIERLTKALHRIADWELPPTTDGKSYAWHHGSNGERDVIRDIARTALVPAAAQLIEAEGSSPQGKGPSDHPEGLDSARVSSPEPSASSPDPAIPQVAQPYDAAFGGEDDWSRLETSGEATGCFPCDTCHGFRGKGERCAFCIGKLKAYERAEARLAEAERILRRAAVGRCLCNANAGYQCVPHAAGKFLPDLPAPGAKP